MRRTPAAATEAFRTADQGAVLHGWRRVVAV